jgi:hypothetical protein
MTSSAARPDDADPAWRFHVEVGDLLREVIRDLARDVAREVVEEERSRRAALPVKEAAFELGMSVYTLKRWVNERGAPHMRYGGPNGNVYVVVEDIRAWSGGRDSK